MARLLFNDRTDYRRVNFDPDTYRIDGDADYDIDLLSASLFVYRDDFETFVVEGENFTFNGEELTGTATAFTLKRNGEDLFSFQDLRISLASLNGANYTVPVDNIVVKGDIADLAKLLASDDEIIGSEFDDRMAGFAGDDTINGEGGDDWLEGWSGNDSLFGDEGDDWLVGGLGNDYLDGGSGSDWADYRDSKSTVNVNLAVGSATGGAGSDQLESIENVRGSIFNDVIVGDGGSNILRGGRGNDTIDGGPGSDDIDYRDAPRAVTVNLSLQGTTTANTPAQNTGWGNDKLVNFEGVRGSRFDDVLTGLSASGSTSFLRGGEGDDTLIGHANSFDFADYRNAKGLVTVDLGKGKSSGADGVDSFTSIEGIRGGDYNDKLIGDAGNNVLRGGRGNDLLDGGAGIDTADYRDATAGVKVDLRTGRSAGDQGVDKLVRIENLRGSDFNDTLIGNTGQNRLVGASGKDLLYGGKDSVQDIFEFVAVSDSVVGSNRDLIYEFTAADKINLSLIDANTTALGDQAFAFGAGAGSYRIWISGPIDADGVGGANDRIVYGDINGNTTADFEIGIVGAASLTLTASNFVL